jgi:hypothetical protein
MWSEKKDGMVSYQSKPLKINKTITMRKHPKYLISIHQCLLAKRPFVQKKLKNSNSIE